MCHSASAQGSGEVSTCNYEARTFRVRSGKCLFVLFPGCLEQGFWVVSEDVGALMQSSHQIATTCSSSALRFVTTQQVLSPCMARVCWLHALDASCPFTPNKLPFPLPVPISTCAHAGMMISDAKARCPSLLVVPYEFDKYEEASLQVCFCWVWIS